MLIGAGLGPSDLLVAELWLSALVEALALDFMEEVMPSWDFELEEGVRVPLALFSEGMCLLR